MYNQPNKIDKLPVLFQYSRPYNQRKNEVYRKSNDSIKLVTVFHPFPFKSGRIFAAPHLSPTGYWLGYQRESLILIGYPTPYFESSICLFLLFRVYMRGAEVELHQSYHPHPFVKCG